MASRIPGATLELLLAGEPWTAYVARREILGESGPSLEASRQASIRSPLVQSLIEGLEAWPGTVLASHKSAEQSFHRLSLAAQLGCRRGEPRVEGIARLVMSHRSEEGPFALPMNIGEAHGGSGEEAGGWALCDAPVILRALARMGYGEEPGVEAAIASVIALARPSGWPCAVSKSLGGFRGPGRKDDPCPYATLVMVELLLELPGSRRGAAGDADLAAGVECLLSLWEESRTRHPYIFYMGTDFRKLKAPLLWYDILHVLDALSRVPGIGRDARYQSMLDVLESKAGPGLLFTPESVYMAWKAFDFGQKKSASPYLSALALGILARAKRLRA